MFPKTATEHREYRTDFYLQEGVWLIDLPYKIWYPVNPYARGWFELNFTLQVACAYSSSAGILTTDLLLCGLGMQICMQFDRLANRLRALKAKGDQWARQDFAELRTCVIRHNRLIKLIFCFRIFR